MGRWLAFQVVMKCVGVSGELKGAGEGAEKEIGIVKL